MICNEIRAVLKQYNIKRHYEKKHFQNYLQYTGCLRIENFEASNLELKLQQYLFTKVSTEQEAATNQRYNEGMRYCSSRINV